MRTVFFFFSFLLDLNSSSTFELKKNPEGNGVLVPKLLLHLVHVLQWKPEGHPTKEVEDKTSKDDGQDNATQEEKVDKDEEGQRTKKAITFLQTRCSLLMRTLPKSDEVKYL